MNQPHNPTPPSTTPKTFLNKKRNPPTPNNLPLTYSTNWFTRNNHPSNPSSSTELSLLYKEHLSTLKTTKHLPTSTTFSIENKTNTPIPYTTTPPTTFASIPNTSPTLLNNCKQLRFTHLTSIQQTIIPLILSNIDVIATAPTGTGKTIAYLFPTISSMLNKGYPLQHSNYSISKVYPITLILVPTRELADQVEKEAKKLSNATGITVVKIYGGIPYETQLLQMSYGCDIIISTPGRLIDYLQTETISLEYISTIILDEADKMLEMGFKEQLKQIFLHNNLPHKTKRLNILLSATFNNETNVISRTFVNHNKYLYIKPSDQNDFPNIKQQFVFVKDGNSKMDMLVKQLHLVCNERNENVIVFVMKKKTAESVYEWLVKKDIQCCVIHGNLKQNERMKAIDDFQKGKEKILVATDIAGRGIDFINVSYVVNYDIPKCLEDFVHRIGRTGRMGREGNAITIVVNDDIENNKNVLKQIKNYVIERRQQVPKWLKKID